MGTRGFQGINGTDKVRQDIAILFSGDHVVRVHILLFRWWWGAFAWRMIMTEINHYLFIRTCCVPVTGRLAVLGRAIDWHVVAETDRHNIHCIRQHHVIDLDRNCNCSNIMIGIRILFEYIGVTMYTIHKLDKTSGQRTLQTSPI
jgi:hypothetical protein